MPLILHPAKARDLHPVSILLYREMISYFVDDGHVCDYCKGLKGIKYLTDEPALTVMFRFDEEYVPGEG